MTPRLAVLATHPIQYHGPLFRRVAERGVLDLRVYYGWEGAAGGHAHDPGFGRAVKWDVPLLEGYEHEFLPNRAAHPGTARFRGLDCPDVAERITAEQPDAVLVFGWAWKSHLRALQRLHARVPVLFRGDSTLLGERPGPRRLARRAWLRWVYRHVDCALYVGQRNRAYFLAHGLPEEKLAWMPHAVDNARFADPEGTHEAAARAWRRELAIPDDAMTVVFAGKLDRNKAPEVLLSACAAIRDPAVHLVVAGSGPLEDALRAQAAGRDDVHFVGFQNQSRMPVVYRLGDVFVLPSRSETWGLAVNEAMASGRPVVVTDRVGCAPDLVREGESGHVVRVDDVEALRRSLCELAADPERRRRQGAAAARVIDAWSIEHAATALEATVERTCTAEGERSLAGAAS